MKVQQSLGLQHNAVVNASHVDGSEQWYLLHSKPRQEDLAAEHLLRQGYRVCCPKLRLPKMRRDRWELAVEPLFPRYLFAAVRVGEQALQPLHATRGVSRVVRFGDTYARVQSTLIERLERTADGLGVHEFRSSPFEPGKRVRVFAGPFRDFEGVFERAEGHDRVHLLLDILGGEARVTLAASLVVPVIESRTAWDVA
jgi:transcriptional antiterminator RfaH